MSDTKSKNPPPASKLTVAFSLGLVLGLGLVLPAIQAEFPSGIASLNTPIVRTIAVGILALTAITLAVYGLFFMFALSSR